MDINEANSDDELKRRYRATSTTINGLMALILVVTIVGWFVRDSIYRPHELWTSGSVPIAIVVLAIGAIVFRRSRFQAARLQDVAVLNGVSGLLRTLQNTSLSVAFIALAIVLLGVVGMILTQSFSEVVRASAVGFVLLIYCYPKKRAWERVVHEISAAGETNHPETVRGNQ